MLDVIICAIFAVEKLRGLGNTRSQILEFPIEMAGHLYNRAGATAQPVMGCIYLTHTIIYDSQDFRSDGRIHVEVGRACDSFACLCALLILRRIYKAAELN